MRINELLKRITPYGSMSPAEYSLMAKQRDAALKQKRLAAQKARQHKQKLQHQQIWAMSRAPKPKPVKLKVPTRRRLKPRRLRSKRSN